VCSTFLNVVFCLDFSLFLFFLLFPCQVFFLYLLSCSTPFLSYWSDKLIMGKAPNFESPIFINVHRFFP
jgi:hypothetical protein